MLFHVRFCIQSAPCIHKVVEEKRTRKHNLVTFVKVENILFKKGMFTPYTHPLTEINHYKKKPSDIFQALRAETSRRVKPLNMCFHSSI